MSNNPVSGDDADPLLGGEELELKSLKKPAGGMTQRTSPGNTEHRREDGNTEHRT